ncbi:MAG: response regulator transcription factor [Chloroflexi bacterium]|nr:response regulator transcription factor [Chloroflexota bacterium]
MAATVLIVGTDKAAATTYASYLKKDYTVLAAHSGRQAIAHARSHRLDAMIVDITSARLNCKNVCRKLAGESRAPLVLIAPPNAKVDGAYSAATVVYTPVVGRKLVARVKAAIDSKPPRQLVVSNVALDFEKQRVVRGGKSFPLTPKEFFLLKYLMGRAGQTITRKTLMKEVWETDFMGDTRTLDVHIRWVREKVEDNPSKPQRLITMRGQGYRFVVE